MAPVKKKSPLWNYFDVCEENHTFAVCLLCKAKISRGGEGKKAGTSAMKNHVKSKHNEQFRDIQDTKSTSPTSEVILKKDIVSLATAIEKTTHWDIDDSRAKEYNYLIGEMIALDHEPSALGDRIGFKRLMSKAVPRYKIPSHTYVSETILPDIYARIQKKIESNISQATAISVTADMWTCPRNSSYLSFRAHWISNEFRLEHAVLAIKPFEGSHTGDNIAKELNAVAGRWNIPDAKIHLLVHNSGANMVKGDRVAHYDSARCFLHSLHLVVNEALAAQPEVVETITVARRIVTHFHHLGSGILEAIQRKLHLPEHELVQDVGSRWNSTYYMQERLLEQKRAVCLYISDHANTPITNLDSYQWELIDQLTKLLKPIEEITKITSSGLSCISEVIPHAAALMRYLDKEDTVRRTSDLSTVRATLKVELKKRLYLEGNLTYSIATLLDPRFKMSYLGADQANNARQRLLVEGFKLYCDESCSRGLDNPPLSKKNRTQADVQAPDANAFWDCFDEVGNDNDNHDLIAGMSTVASELEFYLKTVRIDRNTDVYDWWSKNTKQYPELAKLARRYLSVPCSSVHSERLFSEIGLAYENKRNSLLPLKSEEMVFIHHNLPLVEFKY